MKGLPMLQCTTANRSWQPWQMRIDTWSYILAHSTQVLCHTRAHLLVEVQRRAGKTPVTECVRRMTLMERWRRSSLFCPRGSLCLVIYYVVLQQ